MRYIVEKSPNTLFSNSWYKSNSWTESNYSILLLNKRFLKNIYILRNLFETPNEYLVHRLNIFWHNNMIFEQLILLCSNCNLNLVGN